MAPNEKPPGDEPGGNQQETTTARSVAAMQRARTRRALRGDPGRDERWCRWKTWRWLDRRAREYGERVGAFERCPRYRCGCGDDGGGW